MVIEFKITFLKIIFLLLNNFKILRYLELRNAFYKTFRNSRYARFNIKLYINSNFSFRYVKTLTLQYKQKEAF